jgi:O-antigen ligase
VLLLTALLVAAWSPSASVASCLIALPTVFTLQSLPWGRYSLVELGIVVGAAGYALRRFVEDPLRGWLLDLRMLFAPSEIAFSVIAIVAVAGLSLITVAQPEFLRESLREVRLVIVIPVVFLCLARLVWRDKHARSWSAVCLQAIGGVLAAAAIGQVALGEGGVVVGELARANVTYPHPNNLALFLERTALFTAGSVLMRPRSRWLWALFLLQICGVLATFSRGALVAVFVGAVALLWWAEAKQALKLVGIGFAALVLFMVVFARDRLFDLGGQGNEPTRFALWRGSIRMIQDSVITGVGPDQFLYQYWRRYAEPAAWPERFTSHPHNIVLDVWLRLGVSGVAVMIWLGAGILHQVSRLRRQRADRVAAGAIAALAGGLAHGMVDNGFFLPDLAVLTWAFVAWLLTAPADAAP